MVPFIAYCGKCGKILALTVGLAKVTCPECGRVIEAKPIERRRTVGAAG